MKFSVIDLFDKAYSRLPSFGTELKDFTVRILPQFTIVFGILITLASVLDFLGSAFITSFTLGGPQIIQQLLLRSVLGIAQGVIMIFAFRPMKNHQQKGWRLLFWSQVLWIIAAAITFNTAIILGFLILYPLFQVRSQYR